MTGEYGTGNPRWMWVLCALVIGGMVAWIVWGPWGPR
jgi:hypothetical protein